MSKYERDITAACEAETDERARHVLRLQHSIYLSRKEDLQSARDLCMFVRKACSASADPLVFGWLNLAEGIHDYFALGPQNAIPKLVRSKVIAGTSRDGLKVINLACAWLGNVYRILERWDDFRAELIECRRSWASCCDEAKCRIGIVLADANLLIGNEQLARRLYAYVRLVAVKMGDDLSIEAMMHNGVSIGLFNERMNAIRDSPSGLPRDSSLVSAAIRSAYNYSQYIGDASTPWTFLTLTEQAHILRGEWAEADALLTSGENEIALVDKRWPWVAATRRADRLLCSAKLGSISRSEAEIAADSLIAGLPDFPGTGDRAIILFAIAKALECLGSPSYVSFLQESQRNLTAYEEGLRQCAVALQECAWIEEYL